MEDIKETKAKVDALSTQLTEMQERITEDVAALKATIAQHDIEQAVLSEINQGLDTISARVKAIDPDPANPQAPPETP